MSGTKVPKEFKKIINGKKPLSLQQKLKIGLLLVAIVCLGALAWSYFTQKPAESCGEEWGKLKVRVNDNYGCVVRDANVSVWWNGELMRSGLTDSEGDISFNHLYYDWYNVTVTKSCFSSTHRFFQFDHDQHNVRQTFTLWYLNFSLTLNVTDSETGLIIPNASVLVYRYDYLDVYQEFYSETNNSGIATFEELEYDEYAIIVTHAEYFNYTALIFMDTDTTLRISLQRIPSSPDDPGLSLPTLAIGITIGFITCTLALWFFLLQRRLREAEPKKGSAYKW